MPQKTRHKGVLRFKDASAKQGTNNCLCESSHSNKPARARACHWLRARLQRPFRARRTSSTNSTQGASLAASEKAARTLRTPSPSHLEAMLDGASAKKDAPHSAAAALASRVLPVPAGQASQTTESFTCRQHFQEPGLNDR